MSTKNIVVAFLFNIEMSSGFFFIWISSDIFFFFEKNVERKKNWEWKKNVEWKKLHKYQKTLVSSWFNTSSRHQMISNSECITEKKKEFINSLDVHPIDIMYVMIRLTIVSTTSILFRFPHLFHVSLSLSCFAFERKK